MPTQIQDLRRANSLPHSRGDSKSLHTDTARTHNSDSPSPRRFAEDREWLKEVQLHVEQNLDNSCYTITQLAAAVAISERQLRRRLKKLLGIGPRQYLTQRRLEHARSLLINRKFKTLAQTAYAVGYRDVDSFRNIFMKEFGTSPREYLR